MGLVSCFIDNWPSRTAVHIATQGGSCQATVVYAGWVWWYHCNRNSSSRGFNLVSGAGFFIYLFFFLLADEKGRGLCLECVARRHGRLKNKNDDVVLVELNSSTADHLFFTTSARRQL